MSEAAVADAPTDTSVADASVDATKTDAAADTPADNAASKPEGDKPADAKAPDAKADATADKPVDYAFTMPEGMELDKVATDEFVAFAKELKLPKDQAQKVVDIAVRREQARVAEHKATVDGWAADVKADKEIGGEKLAENLAIAKKAIDLGPPELKEFLNSTGLGNHPAMVKWALTVGKTLSEDRFVSGVKAPAESRSLEDRLYPKSK